MRGHRGLLASPGLWFAVALSASAAFGVEKWRRNTARSATRAERARMGALVTCLLGDDGHGFARDVGRTRARLRALATQSSLYPSPFLPVPCPSCLGRGPGTWASPWNGALRFPGWPRRC